MFILSHVPLSVGRASGGVESSRGFVMRNRGLIGIGIGLLGVVLSGAVAAAQDLSRYREFELGSSVAAVSGLTGVAGSELKTIHQRPVVIQELTWRPKYGARRPIAPATESVDRVVFDFSDDQLFRVTVDYDRTQTEGLIDADMIQAISRVYGPPVTPVPSRRRQPPPLRDDAAMPIAEWTAASHSVKLHRLTSYAAGFRLVITDEPIAARAHTASAQAVVLDAREAPQREAAREKKEADARRAADEKARSTNKATFRP